MTSSEPGAKRQSDLAAQSPETASDNILAVSTEAEEDGRVTLVLVGEVDIFTAPLLRSAIDGQLDGRPRELVLDFSAVEFLGSAGLAALVEAWRSARERDVALRLMATGRAVIRPLQVTGLIDLFIIGDGTTD